MMMFEHLDPAMPEACNGSWTFHLYELKNKKKFFLKKPFFFLNQFKLLDSVLNTVLCRRMSFSFFKHQKTFTVENYMFYIIFSLSPSCTQDDCSWTGPQRHFFPLSYSICEMHSAS